MGFYFPWERRETGRPFGFAGDWQDFPLRVLTPKRFAQCIIQVQGFDSPIFAPPFDVADDGYHLHGRGRARARP